MNGCSWSIRYCASTRATSDLPTPPFSPPMKWMFAKDVFPLSMGVDCTAACRRSRRRRDDLCLRARPGRLGTPACPVVTLDDDVLAQCRIGVNAGEIPQHLAAAGDPPVLLDAARHGGI